MITPAPYRSPPEETALSAADLADLVIGCVAENNPKFLGQAIRLVQSIRWFGGELSSARVLVCVVDRIDDAPRRILEHYGAEVRVVPRFDARNAPANRLRFFAEAWEKDDGMLLVLDCDTVVVRDPLPFLRRGVFQAKITPVPSVTHDAFERVFRHYGIELPPRQYLTGVTRTPTIRYCNTGVLALPGALARTFIPVWSDFNASILDRDRLDLLGSCAHHCHQASLSLAFAACPIPFEEMPVELNYQLNVAHLPPPEGFLEVDPAILHYHHLTDSAGYLLPCPFPRAQARIDAFNQRLRREKERPGAPALGAGSAAQIAVLGMHRSGTSAVTRLLHGMGCYGGPEDRFPIPDEANPKGYWENSDVVILDDALLTALGGQWCDVGGLDLSHLSTADREIFRNRARELVREFDSWAPWVIKDPRLCLLFPFWREILERPVCVLVWRDPLPVARSLKKRHGLPLLLGIALWEHYNREALASTLGLPRVLVSYRNLVDDPAGTVGRLYGELVRLCPAGGDRFTLPPEEEILAFIAPSLERQCPDPELEQEYLNAPQLRLLQTLANGEAFNLDPVPPLSQGAREVLVAHSEKRARLKEIETLQGRTTTLRDKAMGLTRQLDDVISALLASHSWRIGRALTSPLRRLLGRTSELTADDHRDRIMDERKRALDSKSFEPG